MREKSKSLLKRDQQYGQVSCGGSGCSVVGSFEGGIKPWWEFTSTFQDVGVGGKIQLSGEDNEENL